MSHREVELLGIGAGPSNLALAVALEELAPPTLAANSLLVEQTDGIAWQRGMLIPWTESQVSFLKDLATLRNPRSKFTFVNFLHQEGRLDDFISLGTFTPYRSEISDYLRWVAGQLDRVRIEYNRRCTGISANRDGGGDIAGWRVSFADGSTVDCRYLAFGGGRDPYVPEVFRALSADRAVHSIDYVHRVSELRKTVPHRVAVVGGAQSAAEMVQAVQDDLPLSSCTMLVRAIGLTPYETSKFTSRFYAPPATEEFFNATPDGRELLLGGMLRSGYSGVTPELLDGLHRRIYLERLTGKQRLRIQTATEVVAVREADGEMVLTVVDRRDGTRSEHRCDLVLLGTGYTQGMPGLIRELGGRLGLRRFDVSRNYRLRTSDAESGAAVYVQGVNEETHGIADSLLSVIAHRAAEIVGDILVNRG
jgi:L-ornithine N5-oxygenase